MRRTWAAIIIGLGLALQVQAQSLPSPQLFGVRMEVGDLDQARRWLAAGLDPDFMAERIGTGLMIGAWHGNIPLMDLFVSRGADVNKANALGEQALLHAAWQGRLEAVKWLLAHGAQTKRDGRQWTALHYAVFAGHREIAQILIEHGADLNARSPNGSSVLMMAVYEGREELAELLVGRGAERGLKNDWGEGALDWAMKFNHLKIARLVAPREQFAAAASQPKAHWGEPRRSEPASPELVRLLRLRGLLETRGLSVERVDREIAAERARMARAGIDRKAVPPRSATLEITAKKGAPGEQKATLIYEDQGGPAPARTPAPSRPQP